jgi:hypothetical protein
MDRRAGSALSVVDQGRKSRHEHTAKLRKGTREEERKRRRVDGDHVPETMHDPERILEDILYRISANASLTPDDLHGMRVALSSCQDDSMVRRVVQFGIVRAIASSVQHPACRLDAIWILTNLTGGPKDCTKVVLGCMDLPRILECFRNAENTSLYLDIVYMMGNVGIDYPDALEPYQSQLVPLIIGHAMDRVSDPNYVALSLWAVLVMCSLHLEDAIASAIVQCMNFFATRPMDTVSCTYIAKILTRLVGANTQRIAIVTSNPAMIAFIHGLCMNPEHQVVGLKLLANLLSGTTDQTGVLITADVLAALLDSVRAGRPEAPEAVVVAMLAISNILRESVMHVHVLYSHGFFPWIVHRLSSRDSMDVREQAAYTVMTVVEVGRPEHVDAICTPDCVAELVGLMNYPDIELQINLLLSVERLMERVAHKQRLIQAGIGRVLDALVMHDHEEINTKAQVLLSHIQ